MPSALSFRLAHISDIHLGPLPHVKRSELLSKRITGYINWYRNRSDSLDDGALDNLVDHMKAAKPDHVAVTGDLVNLALKEELLLVRDWLQDLGPPEDVSVIPGNHDTYVPGALKQVVKQWGDYMTGDVGAIASVFPYLRIRDHVALVGVNSGRATMPFMATGSFKHEQAKALEKLLKETAGRGLFRVIMIHHPPFKGATSRHKRLIGASRFRDVIERCGAELILHGHTHIDSFQLIDGPNGTHVPVVGVPSASHGPSLQDEALGPESRKPGARYNLFEIDGKPGAWTCHMQEFGYVGSGKDIVPIQDRMIGVPADAQDI